MEVGLSRNVGIENSKGKYICFLDDDDEFYPTKIKEQYDFYCGLENNNNVAMVYCFAEMVNVNGKSYYRERLLNGNLLKENTLECIAATSWWFCPREKLLSVGGFEDISSRQDASLLLKFFLKGYEVYCLPKVLLKYYWHDSNNGISKNNYKSIEAEKKYLNIFLNNSNHINEQERKEVLYIFYYRLSMLYILIGNRGEALNEFLAMVKIRKFSLKNIKILLGILFNKTYCLLSKIKNYRRYRKK